MAPARGNPDVLTVGATGRGFCPCWEVLTRYAQSRAPGQGFLFGNAHSQSKGASKQASMCAAEPTRSYRVRRMAPDGQSSSALCKCMAWNRKSSRLPIKLKHQQGTNHETLSLRSSCISQRITCWRFFCPTCSAGICAQDGAGFRYGFWIRYAGGPWA